MDSVGTLDFLPKVTVAFETSKLLIWYSNDELRQAVSWWGLYYLELSSPNQINAFVSWMKIRHSLFVTVVDNFSDRSFLVQVVSRFEYHKLFHDPVPVLIMTGSTPCVNSEAERRTYLQADPTKWFHTILDGHDRNEIVKTIQCLESGPNFSKLLIVHDLFAKKALSYEYKNDLPPSSKEENIKIVSCI